MGHSGNMVLLAWFFLREQSMYPSQKVEHKLSEDEYHKYLQLRSDKPNHSTLSTSMACFLNMWIIKAHG